MPSIEFGSKAVQTNLAASPIERRKPMKGSVGNDRAVAVADEHSAVVRSRTLDPGEAPVDAERVSQIRKAIEQGTYPIVPTKVADAIIAAGLLLRNGK